MHPKGATRDDAFDGCEAMSFPSGSLLANSLRRQQRGRSDQGSQGSEVNGGRGWLPGRAESITDANENSSRFSNIAQIFFRSAPSEADLEQMLREQQSQLSPVYHRRFLLSSILLIGEQNCYYLIYK